MPRSSLLVRRRSSGGSSRSSLSSSTSSSMEDRRSSSPTSSSSHSTPSWLIRHVAPTSSVSRFSRAGSASSSHSITNSTTSTALDSASSYSSASGAIPPRRTSLAHLSSGIDSRRRAESEGFVPLDLEPEGRKRARGDQAGRSTSRARGLGSLGSQSVVYLPLLTDLGEQRPRNKHRSGSTGTGALGLKSASAWDLPLVGSTDPQALAHVGQSSHHLLADQRKVAASEAGYKPALLRPASPLYITHRPLSLSNLLDLDPEGQHLDFVDTLAFPLPPSPASTVPSRSASLTGICPLESPTGSESSASFWASGSEEQYGESVCPESQGSSLRRAKATRKRRARNEQGLSVQVWQMEVQSSVSPGGVPVTPPMTSTATFDSPLPSPAPPTASAPAIPPRAQSRPNRNLRPVPSAASILPSTPSASTPSASAESLELRKDSGSSATSGGPETPVSAVDGGSARGRRRSGGKEASNEDGTDEGYFGAADVPQQRVLDLSKLSLANDTPLATDRDRAAIPTPRSSVTAASRGPSPSSAHRGLAPAPRGVSLGENSTPHVGGTFKLPAMLRTPSDERERPIQNNRKVSNDSVMSAASGSSQSFITAAHSRASSFTRSTIMPAAAQMQNLAPAPGGYMNARMAREAENQRELDKRKKAARDTSVGVVVKEDGTVVRDGYKIVDGQPKRSSSSGVYTPPTFPGPNLNAPSSANSHRQSVSPYGPASESMFNGSASVTSPRSAGGFFSTPQLSSRKSAFGAAIAKVAAPLMSPRDSVISTASSTDSVASGRLPNDGWRKSTLYSPSRGETDRYRSPISAPILPGGSPRYARTASSGAADVEPDRSPLNGVYLDDGGRVVASPQRMRALSEALQNATPATDGMGLGYGIKLRSLDVNPRSVSEGHTPMMGSDEEGRFEANGQPQRPRNVKGLTLPLTASMALHEAMSEKPTAGASSGLQEPLEIGQPTQSESAGEETAALQSAPTMAGVNKGVKRKPVPQIRT